MACLQVSRHNVCSHIAQYCVRLSPAMINVAASDTMHAAATRRDGTRSKEHDETCHVEGGRDTCEFDCYAETVMC